MDLQEVWSLEYQITHYKQPVYRAFAEFSLEAKLKKGQTVHRTYASDFVVNDLGGDGAYSTQAVSDTDETLTVSTKKEVSFYLTDVEELQAQLPVRIKYARKAMNRLFLQIDGDVLSAAYQAAGSTIDDGSIGGTTGNSIVATVANVQNIFINALQALQLQNIIFDPAAQFTGEVKQDRISTMPIAVVSPQLYGVLLNYVGGKNSAFGDRVAMNGHLGQFMGFNLFSSNNSPYSAQLQIPTNPTDGDTIAINGVTLTFKTTVDAGVTAGQVKIASTAALTATNLAAFLNAPGTTVADSTNAGYNAVSTANQALLKNLVASVASSTNINIKMAGRGSVVVSSVFTSANNSWPVTLQTQHLIFGVNNSISIVIQKTPNMIINPVSGKVGKDIVTWTLYGIKVFKDQVPMLVDVQINTNGFTSPANIFY
jgi:hypothetical protein